MTRGELPAEVRRFILVSIPSVPYLEAVLLLRAEPDVLWNAARLGQRLYVNERVAGDLLRELAGGAIAQAQEAGGGWHYAPHADLAQLLDALAAAYTHNLVGVTDLIHSRVDKRAQQFADAFRFRKE